MDDKIFKLMCKKVIDFIILYKNNKFDNKVFPNIQPGDILSKLQPIKKESEDFNVIFNDFKDLIFPNILDWQHPYFLGYFPSCNSYPSIIGEFLSAGLGIIGFSWISSPSSTELEIFCINEFIRIMKLPFDNGVILNSSSESILITLICAKNKYKNDTNLVMYTTELANICVFKNAKLSNTKLKIIKHNSMFEMDIEDLKLNIEQDILNGLKPFYVLATFGTTSVLSFDNIQEIGKLCKQYNIYLHVDGAYGGCTLICKRYRKMLKGLSYVDSFNLNPNKLLLINFDCTFLFFNNKNMYLNLLQTHTTYLSNQSPIDFKNYDLSLSRRFRSLKIWFTLRSYGIKKMQKHILKMFKYTKILKYLLLEDKRIHIINDIKMGLICFQIKDKTDSIEIINQNTKFVYDYINQEGFMFISCGTISNIFFIRISLNNIYSKIILYKIRNYISFVVDKLFNCENNNIFSNESLINLVEKDNSLINLLNYNKLYILKYKYTCNINNTIINANIQNYIDEYKI